MMAEVQEMTADIKHCLFVLLWQRIQYIAGFQLAQS